MDTAGSRIRASNVPSMGAAVSASSTGIAMTAPVLVGRYDDFGFSPAVEKEALLKFDAINAVMQTYRQNAPLKFFPRVLAVPVPDSHGADRFDAEQVSPGRHCDGLNE